jgi:hypothetical protein
MIIAVAAACSLTSAADAQWVTTYYRAPTTVYYSPAPAATSAYYAPAPHSVYYAPAPRVAYYAPAPAPVAVAPVYATRYRPLLGGGITRVRYRYAPVAYAAPPATVVHYPAW